MAVTHSTESSVAQSNYFGTAALGDVILNTNGFPFVSILLKTVATAAVTIQGSNDGTNYIVLATSGGSGDYAFNGVYPCKYFKVVAGSGSTVANIAYNFTRGAR